MKSFRKVWLAVITMMTVFVSNVSARADEEALQTPEGISVKVVAKGSTAMYREPSDSAANEPVEQFEFFFGLAAEERSDTKTKNGFYRVARSVPAKAADGWVKESDFVEWNHSQVVGFSPSGSRAKVLFFTTREDVFAWLKGEPGAEAKAISREPAIWQAALFPLLSVSSAENSSGETTEIYELAYLTGTTGGGGATGVAKTESARSVSATPASVSETIPRNREELSKSFMLQVCFCIDTTASMTPWIDSMKSIVAQVVAEVQKHPELEGRVEFAIVGFRDQLESQEDQLQLEYVTKVLSEFTSDLAAFQERLASVSVAVIGSEDHPEDAIAGAFEAHQKLAWNKSAYKHLIVMSDAPFQTGSDGYKNVTKQSIAGLLALLQPTTATAAFDRVQIHGLRVVSEMPTETEAHFAELTHGRDVAGIHSAYASQGDEAKFVAEWSGILSEFAKTTGDVVRGNFTAIQQQNDQAPVGSDTQKRLGPVLEMIKAVSGDPGASTSGFERGFAAVIDNEGNRALEPYVLVSQLQLKLFASAVEHCVLSLESAGDAGSRDVTRVVQNLQVLGSSVSLKEDIHPDMPLHQLLSRILGIPVRSPVFALTPAKLAAMTSADFEAWKEQVKVCHSICDTHLTNGTIWFSLSGNASAMGNDLSAFIKVSDLP